MVDSWLVLLLARTSKFKRTTWMILPFQSPHQFGIDLHIQRHRRLRYELRQGLAYELTHGDAPWPLMASRLLTSNGIRPSSTYVQVVKTMPLAHRRQLRRIAGRLINRTTGLVVTPVTDVCNGYIRHSWWTVIDPERFCVAVCGRRHTWVLMLVVLNAD